MLAGYLHEATQKSPDSPAVLTLDRGDLSYRELERRVKHLAGALRNTLDLRQGDRVALAMSNTPQYIELLYACWYAGLCVAPMNARLHPREFAGLVEDCAARVCFTTPDITRSLEEAFAPGIQVCDVTTDTYDSLLEQPPHTGPVDTTPDSPAWLFYTSGTTGKPKGATLTHRNLDAMSRSFLSDTGAAVDEVLLHIAPLSHAGGLFGLSYVAQGLPQLVLPPLTLTEDLLQRSITKAGTVSFFAVPTVLNRLMDGSLLPEALIPHIRKIFVGGAPVYANDLEAAIAHFGADRLWAAYGQGEAPCTITHLPSSVLEDTGRDDYDAVIASVGIARSGVEVSVAGEQGQPLPPGEIGEVVVRGDVVMAGYWNRPDATAATLQNGWLHTGDLGRMSANGFLTLVDRSKDMIISGGSNIYPREIEEVLVLHPGVSAVAVVGAQDPEWGEVPVAFVAAKDPIDARALEEFCLDRMARYKRPKRYIFVDDLPKSSYGKVLKSALRDQLLQTD